MWGILFGLYRDKVLCVLMRTSTILPQYIIVVSILFSSIPYITTIIYLMFYLLKGEYTLDPKP